MVRLLFLLLFFFISPLSIAWADNHIVASDKMLDDKGAVIATLSLLAPHSDNGADYVGLELNLAKHWKTYSNRPDSGGLPPTLNYNNSTNIKDIALLYPKDKKFIFQNIVSYGYEGRVIFPLQIIKLDANQSVHLQLSARFLICDIICIPADFALAGDITTGNNGVVAKAIADARNNNTVAVAEWASLLFYLAIGLLGGVLLNFMPCALPALSLKVHSLTKKKPDKNIASSLLATALGMVVFFFSLGLLLWLTKIMGIAFFWGNYFQSVWFLLLMAGFFIIMLLVALNNLPLKITSHYFIIFALQKLLPKKLAGGDFFFGFTIAIFAATCLAPFVGASLTFAASHPYPLALSLMTLMIGIGLASPWFFLWWASRHKNHSFILCVQHFLQSPKRQNVMLVFNIMVALLTLLIVFWLLMLLQNHLPPLIGYGLWFGLFLLLVWSLRHHYRQKIFWGSMALYFLLVLLLLFRPPHRPDGRWQDFATTQDLDKQATLLVVTADWCITCQVNEKLIFDKKNFIDLIEKNKIRLVRADWTMRDDKITALLQKENRLGIPLTIYYDGRGGKKILPEILSLRTIESYVSIIISDTGNLE